MLFSDLLYINHLECRSNPKIRPTLGSSLDCLGSVLALLAMMTRSHWTIAASTSMRIPR
ncbi:hypothetical protein BDV37DRAFT_256699 [Aspergillus pseudonomiae]|uniref:Uncharacterized protein n=1 Tax=Aspergillus pseudonomiae TaxID=1506151 RepID=A0A5N7D320_9EURO|nr:uncharacterized protein BDV37DRAFT_256699 [Aspergillus pseudonomiae]KAE8400796.1 hypothetical protein BDV37DRAFT_256699 [Aspergillus pseudonomiae]